MSKIRQRNFQKIADQYPAQIELANALDITPGYVNQLLTGHRNIGEKTARKIETRLKLDYLSLDKTPDINEPNAQYAPKLGEFRRIPVVGMAQLGDNGYWCDLDYPAGYGDGYINYPSKDPQAYALRCTGDSMKPRIRDGEFVIVEPNMEAISGDEVLVKSNDGRVMVKTLLYKRNERVYLQSINEAHPSISIAIADISVIHPIAAIVKSALWNKNT